MSNSQRAYATKIFSKHQCGYKSNFGSEELWQPNLRTFHEMAFTVVSNPIKVNIISHDLGCLQDKFGFSDEDMQSVPQAPFKYLRETFKDTAFRASQYKMLHKLIYTKKLLHI